MSDGSLAATQTDQSTRYMDAMRRRRSCRSCEKTPIAADVRASLENALREHAKGPFGSMGRFMLLAATEQDSKALKGFGTYGFVKNPAGFILGAIGFVRIVVWQKIGHMYGEHYLLVAVTVAVGGCVPVPVAVGVAARVEVAVANGVSVG